MVDTRRYKVTNTTVKPLRLSPRGVDIRPIRDRVGHAVQFRLDNQEEYVTLYVNQSKIVPSVNDGLLKLFRKGLVSIDIVNDIIEELKEFSKKPEVAPVETPVKAEPAPVVETKVNAVLGEYNAKSYPMGETRESTPVNPDGEPNFVARAPKGGLQRSKRLETPPANN